MLINNFFKLVISIVVSLSAGIIGSVFTSPAVRSGWYTELAKPALNPPQWVFGPVWTALYVLIGVSLWLVWRSRFEIKHRIWEYERKPWNEWSRQMWFGDWQKFNIVSIFALQLVFNALWSYVFFGLQSPGAALLVIIMLWLAILFAIINFYRVSKPAAYLLVPYILWVSFAIYLNYTIWVLN